LKTKIIETTNGPRNHGKFLLGRFDGEWSHPSAVASESLLLSLVGWGPEHLLVMDLQTGEGAIFRPGGSAKADLDKHAVWVCPLFEPFLEWLYRQDLGDLDKLPAHVDLPDAEFALYGYRRPGPGRHAK
jgi:hypothetical protein